MKKYVSLDKRSKKAQREYYSERRHTWGELNPVTRSVPSGKTYNRKKEKKKIGRELSDGFLADLFYSSYSFASCDFHSCTSGSGERIFISLPRVKSQPQKVGDFWTLTVAIQVSLSWRIIWVSSPN